MQGYRVEHFETVVSTNELVKHGLELGYEEGLVCRAREQVGGYGRQGRFWASPRGGMYQSVLLRPDVPQVQLPTLSLVTALSVRRALLDIGSLAPEIVQVKWPNDVVCAQGKLAGISMEAHAGGVCVGIGVNVRRPVSTEPVGGKNVPAYLGELTSAGVLALADEEWGIDAVGDAVLDELWRRYLRWQRDGFTPFVDEFNACNVLGGKHVDIADRNGAIVKSGDVVGVDAQGSLLVGNQPITSGEAHIV